MNIQFTPPPQDNIELLWENPNYGAEFEAQTIIPPNRNQYKYFILCSKNSSCFLVNMNGFTASLFDSRNIDSPMHSSIMFRNCMITTSGIYIGNCIDYAITQNHIAKPYQIYGIR